MAYKEIEAYKDEKQVHVKHDKYTFYTKDEKSNMWCVAREASS